MSCASHVRIGDPHLFSQEPAPFARALGTSRRHLEFGTGGSTLSAIRQGVGLRLLRIKADASTLITFALLMVYQFDPR